MLLRHYIMFLQCGDVLLISIRQLSKTFCQISLGIQLSTQCQSIELSDATTLQVLAKNKEYDVSSMIVLLQSPSMTSSFVNETI
jgi:hypothetical protein